MHSSTEWRCGCSRPKVGAWSAHAVFCAALATLPSSTRGCVAFPCLLIHVNTQVTIQAQGRRQYKAQQSSITPDARAAAAAAKHIYTWLYIYKYIMVGKEDCSARPLSRFSLPRSHVSRFVHCARLVHFVCWGPRAFTATALLGSVLSPRVLAAC